MKPTRRTNNRGRVTRDMRKYKAQIPIINNSSLTAKLIKSPSQVEPQGVGFHVTSGNTTKRIGETTENTHKTACGISLTWRPKLPHEIRRLSLTMSLRSVSLSVTIDVAVSVIEVAVSPQLSSWGMTCTCMIPSSSIS